MVNHPNRSRLLKAGTIVEANLEHARYNRHGFMVGPIVEAVQDCGGNCERGDDGNYDYVINVPAVISGAHLKKVRNHPNRSKITEADIYAAGFEAGFGFCNYAHNLDYDHPETAEDKAGREQQEADREAYKAALRTIGRSPRLPLGYPFTLDGLGFGKA